MDEFKSLFVGMGFRHLGNYINFLKKGQDMVYELDAFVLPGEKEAQFLNSVESVDSLGIRPVPKIPEDAQNWFFTNGWGSETEAFRLYFNDGKKPMTAYLLDTIHGKAYTSGELLIENKEGENVIGPNPTEGDIKYQKDNRIMVDDLNKLESGLGDKVSQLLESHQSIEGLRRAEREISDLLGQNGFTTSEVFVEGGNRRRYSLDRSFRNDARGYQFADQFDM